MPTGGGAEAMANDLQPAVSLFGRNPDSNPLLSFSLYTAAQSETIERVGRKIISICSTWDREVRDFQEAYDFFWLWVLGAYEILRTMDHNSRSFSPEFRLKVNSLKQELAIIRVPFAKQRLTGRKELPVYAQLSVISTDGGLVFEVQGARIVSGELISKVIYFLCSVRFEDMNVQPLSIEKPNCGNEPDAP